jgi:hypothetical protein
MSPNALISWSVPLADGGQAPVALWMPFAAARHPETDAAGDALVAWLRRFGLLHDGNAAVFRRAAFHELAGRVYHRFDRGGLDVAARFIAALFVLDDLMDTDAHAACRDVDAARAVADVVRAAARSGRAPRGDRWGVGPVAAAMADLTRALRARGAPLEAYLTELDVYLDGVVEEAARRRTRFDGPADYVAVRVAFSAVYACVELGLAWEGTALPGSLREAARQANRSVSLVNDVFSWPKERALGEVSNLVAVEMAAGRGEAAAVAAACAACDAAVAAFLAAAGGTDGPAVGLLAAWMRGNLDWHAVGTRRYADALSVAPVLRAA